MSECGDCRIVADFRHFSSQTGFVLNIELCPRHTSVDELERQVAMHKARANRAEKDLAEVEGQRDDYRRQLEKEAERAEELERAVEAMSALLKPTQIRQLPALVQDLLMERGAQILLEARNDKR